MADATITIPYPDISTVSPAVTFPVVVKDSGGTTVFSGNETNNPFPVAGLADGDYIAYATYNGNTVGYCFTIVNCVCPVSPSAIITSSGVGTAIVYFLELTFDISGGFPNCAFQVNWNDGTASNAITISSLSDFTSHVGTTYKLKIYIYTTHVAYSITTNGSVCVQTTNLVYSCFAPANPVFSIVKIGMAYYLRTVYANCGSSCHDITINYGQFYALPFGSVGDVGSLSVTLDCMDTYPKTVDTLLSPAATYYSGFPASVQYYAISIDCCGTYLSTVVG